VLCGDGGSGTHKLQRRAQWRSESAHGPGEKGQEARAGSGWLKVKECRVGRCR
jgi:hypothetical protein